MAGYDAGRAIAITTGSTEGGAEWLRDHPDADAAYVAGFEWALWDYADANGLARQTPRVRAAS